MAFFSKRLKKDFLGKSSQVLFSKYGLAIVAFLIWITFVDSHNLISQQELKTTIKSLHSEKDKYSKLIVSAREELQDLEMNKEKYAREKYFMHKKNENVFIILNDKTDK